MRNFILGLVVGVAAGFAATKLIDKETREELFDDANKAIGGGRGRALRMGVRARQEYRKGKKKLGNMAGDIANKLSEDLAEIETRVRANS